MHLGGKGRGTASFEVTEGYIATVRPAGLHDKWPLTIKRIRYGGHVGAYRLVRQR